MQVSAAEIARILNGKIEGEESVQVHSIAKIQEAVEGEIAFLANLKYEQYLYSTGASIVLIPLDYVLKQPIKATIIRMEDPYSGFSTLLEWAGQHLKQHPKGIEQPCFIAAGVDIPEDCYVGAFSYISEGVKIGKGVKIYPQTFVGKNCSIGEHTILYAGVKIYIDSIIGKNCEIHAGAVIGSDGFGFAPQADGTYKNVPQIGNVILGDNISIGANTTIDRATMGSTILEHGVKLDNLIQVGHNVKIGENTVSAALTGISGSTEIGKNCVIAGQVGFAGHIKIADKTKIGAQSGIPNSIHEEGRSWLGAPAVDFKESLKSYILIKKLPEIYKRLGEVEKQLNSFQSKENEKKPL